MVAVAVAAATTAIGANKCERSTGKWIEICLTSKASKKQTRLDHSSIEDDDYDDKNKNNNDIKQKG